MLPPEPQHWEKWEYHNYNTAFSAPSNAWKQCIFHYLALVNIFIIMTLWVYEYYFVLFKWPQYSSWLIYYTYLWSKTNSELIPRWWLCRVLPYSFSTTMPYAWNLVYSKLLFCYLEWRLTFVESKEVIIISLLGILKWKEPVKLKHQVFISWWRLMLI